MNVKIYRRDYVNKHGLSPVYLLITSQGKRIRERLAVEVRPEDWDEKSGRLKKSIQNTVKYNLIIDTAVDNQYTYILCHKKIRLIRQSSAFV